MITTNWIMYVGQRFKFKDLLLIQYKDGYQTKVPVQAKYIDFKDPDIDKFKVVLNAKTRKDMA